MPKVGLRAVLTRKVGFPHISGLPAESVSIMGYMKREKNPESSQVVGKGDMRNTPMQNLKFHYFLFIEAMKGKWQINSAWHTFFSYNKFFFEARPRTEITVVVHS